MRQRKKVILSLILMALTLSITAFITWIVLPEDSGKNNESNFSKYGLNVLYYSDNGREDINTRSKEIIANAKKFNSNTLALGIAVFYDDDDSIIFSDSRTPSIDDLEVFARNARSENFSIVVRPLVDNNSLPGDRFNFEPSDGTKFFSSYQAEMIDLFRPFYDVGYRDLSIGVELSKLEDGFYLDSWRGLVREIRSQFPGVVLSYSVDWGRAKDEGVPVLTSLVDVVGIDAYPPSSTNIDSPIEDIIRDWDDYLIEVEDAGFDLSSTPVFEFGAAAQGFDFTEPWSNKISEDLSPEHMAIWTEAACKAFKARGIPYGWLWASDYVTYLEQEKIRGFIASSHSEAIDAFKNHCN